MNRISTTQVMQLVNERNNGNTTSENQLRDLLRPSMFQVCLEICPSADDAEIVLAEGMARTLSDLDSYDARYDFDAWCRSRFVSTAIEYLVCLAEEMNRAVRRINPLRRVA